MRQRPLAVLAALLLVGCGGDGPVFPVQDPLYEWVKTSAAIDPNSDQQPRVADPVVTYFLEPGDRHTALRTGEDWRLGNTILFGFDFRLPQTGNGNTTVDLSRLYRKGAADTEIISVQLDAERGITVMGRTCIAPADLDTWHRVEMRIRLSDEDSGFLEVFCDRKPIWARTKLRTTVPPVCRLQEGCDTNVPTPVQYEWKMGLMSDRNVSQQITVQMKRLHFRHLYYIPNRVGTL